MINFRNNNKGFTLIELIIVIAIIAILAAVIAPQYLGYVEKARQTSDVKMANFINNFVGVDDFVRTSKIAPEHDFMLQVNPTTGETKLYGTNGELAAWQSIGFKP